MANFLIESPASLRLIGLFDGQDEFALAEHSISRESIKCKHLTSGVDAGGRQRDPWETIFVLNVNELRRELKERNLPKSGRKKDLRYRATGSYRASPPLLSSRRKRKSGRRDRRKHRTRRIQVVIVKTLRLSMHRGLRRSL